MALLRRLMGGAAAGAAGTTALNAATYLDMAVRGRPPSTLPDEMAGRLADRLGLDLGDGEAARHRRSALGALLGPAAGVGIGAA